VMNRLADLARVLLALPVVELARGTEGPASLVRRLRQRGSQRQRRDVRGRANLQRLISAVDARLPGSPSCYRRALLEIYLDADAAGEPLHMGLKVPGGPRSGHAWLGGHSAPVSAYDVQVDI
jgi:Transglutaminase-like superfamily